MAMWALPFVAHSLQYDDYYAANLPFVFSAINTIIIVSQSALDCWIFNIKDKPWRQSVKKKGSFVHELAHLKGLRSGWKRSSLVGRAGKSKRAMEEEAMFAYQGRDEERAVRVSEIGSAGRSERRERSWWDEIDDITATINPLPESSVTALVDAEATATDGPASPPQEGIGTKRVTARCTIT